MEGASVTELASRDKEPVTVIMRTIYDPKSDEIGSSAANGTSRRVTTLNQDDVKVL